MYLLINANYSGKVEEGMRKAPEETKSLIKEIREFMEEVGTIEGNPSATFIADHVKNRKEIAG